MTNNAIFPDLPEDLRRAIADEQRLVDKTFLTPQGRDRRRVLIVGGTGYIGIPLSQHLLESGFDVRALDLMLYENHGPAAGLLGHPGYELMVGDLCDAATCDQALAGVTDVIVLAGLVGDPITKAYPDEHQAINEDGLARFLDSLSGRGLNKVVFVSTCSNYGEIPADTTADENFELKPLSLYAKAKVAREQQLLAMGNQADFCGVALRFATAFGLAARMRFDLTVSEFTRDLHSGATLEVYDADTWRPYCHVRDFARALHRVLVFPRDTVAFEVFNAGGDVNNYTKKMIVDAIQDQVTTGEVSFVEGGIDRRNYRVDFAKIRNTLHFEPAFTVPDGVAELARALDQGFFADYGNRLDFYRNRTIRYPVA